MLGFIDLHFWKSFFMQVAGGLVSYDICDVEHYYNTLHRNYTIAELISLHISRQIILLTLLKLFSVVFYL